MINAPTVKTGDRVRVVLEGEVVEVDYDGFDISADGGFGNYISPARNHVVSIDVLAKPFKVGDTFVPQNDPDLMDRLPDGTVLRTGSGCLLVKSRDAWYEPAATGPYAVICMAAPRTIVLLPGE